MSGKLTIPSHLLPRDGRFGSGPSKVRPAQVQAIVDANPSVLGTSHRQAPVRSLVGDVRRMLAELYRLPDGYEVLLSNGGSTFVWDAAAFGLISEKAQLAAFGEFGSKFAASVAAAPHLVEPTVHRAVPGSIALPTREPGVDTYAWPHNETSTGATAPVRRVEGAADALIVIDGTSAAGAIDLDPTQVDFYYFAPQKSFASDGGLWFALASPAAVDRIAHIEASGRYIPPSLSLADVVTNSRAEQTLNTPAISALIMMRSQLEWMLDQGGLTAMAARSQASSAAIYAWADARDFASPFVADPAHRSPVVATVDLIDDVDSSELQAVLRAHGIVDVFPYRKLGRNQLRIGVFPAVDTADVEALLACIDWVVDNW
ncbi:phosphoserine transaminase [Demequina sp.]|uniref:phosphoserine transaminase n=1 Tax=Demequina sp. TaxID=2050685 RepID=UPI0025BEB370|nr:phosphoserine transaminase [Demequina sp.]